MGLAIFAVQNILELYNLGHLKDKNCVAEIGSQELHLTKKDLKEMFYTAGLDSNLIEEYPNVNNWPEKPRTSSKYFYKSLGMNEYLSIDINGDYGSKIHDLNKPFEDKSLFNKFDVVTDFGSCEHVFNISECYRTMHNLTKTDGYIIVSQRVFKGNGYFNFDESFFEGIAAANGYKIIFNSYVVQMGNFSKHDRQLAFHVPRNRNLFNVLDLSKIEGLLIYGILQKKKSEEFKIPYQGLLMNKTYNISGGFNRVYFKEPMSHMYIPSATVTVEDARLKLLIKAIIRKIKLIFRIHLSKKK